MTTKQQKEMANRIKERRAALGYTQEKFSETIGLSISSYAKIENAFQKPSLDTVIKIADKLNLSIDYIIYGEKDKKPPKVDGAELVNSLLQTLDSGKLKHASDVIERLSEIAKNK